MADLGAGHEVDVVAGADGQEECLPVQVDGGRRYRRQQPLQHPQLNSFIWNVIAAAQQLHCLCLPTTVSASEACGPPQMTVRGSHKA